MANINQEQVQLGHIPELQQKKPTQNKLNQNKKINKQKNLNRYEQLSKAENKNHADESLDRLQTADTGLVTTGGHYQTL